MFVGLAQVCDDYFEPALSAICRVLGLKDDVAGATFMAAGGSAPELFTSIMGTFVSGTDVGFGTIVGSAVFNVLFVIAVCAWMCPDLKVTWWPLARDSVFYLLAIVVLVMCSIDRKIYCEALLLLCYDVCDHHGVQQFSAKATTRRLQRDAVRRGLCKRYAPVGEFLLFNARTPSLSETSYPY